MSAAQRCSKSPRTSDDDRIFVASLCKFFALHALHTEKPLPPFVGWGGVPNQVELSDRQRLSCGVKESKWQKC